MAIAPNGIMKPAVTYDDKSSIRNVFLVKVKQISEMKLAMHVKKKDVVSQTLQFLQVNF